MLPQKGITVYDEEKDTIREMRYCPNEPSIWADEQSDNAKRPLLSVKADSSFLRRSRTCESLWRSTP